MSYTLKHTAVIFLLSLTNLIASAPEPIKEDIDLKRSANSGNILPPPPAKRQQLTSSVADVTINNMPIFFSSPVENIPYQVFSEIYEKIRTAEHSIAFDQNLTLSTNDVRIFLHGLQQNSSMCDNFPDTVRKAFTHLAFRVGAKIDIMAKTLSFEECGEIEVKEYEGYADYFAKPLQIPRFVFAIRSLTQLDLSCCNLVTLPHHLSNLQNLTTLNLSGNFLTEIQPFICQMRSLQIIYLVGNPIEYIEHRNNFNFFITNLQCTTKVIIKRNIVFGLAPAQPLLNASLKPFVPIQTYVLSTFPEEKQ